MATAKEKIISKIIDYIALNAEGRLVASKPDGTHADLCVEKRSDYTAKKRILLNIYETGSFDATPQDLEQANFAAPQPDLYFIFAHFDFVKQNLGESFILMPSEGVSSAKEENLNNYRIDQKKFVRFLIDKLDGK